MRLRSYSIVVSHLLRALLYVNELWGSLLMAAVFFTSSGDATPASNPEECSQKIVPFARAIIVGVVSLTLSCLVIITLSNLHSREFVYESESNKQTAIIWKWRILDGILICLSISYSMCCITFVGIFISEVSKRDRNTFMISIGCSLVQSWLLQPILVAAILSYLTTLLASAERRGKAMELILGMEEKDEAQPADSNWHPIWHGVKLHQAIDMYKSEMYSASPAQRQLDRQITRQISSFTLKIDDVD